MGLLKSIWNLMGAEMDKSIDKLSKKIDQKTQEMRDERQKYLESKKQQ